MGIYSSWEEEYDREQYVIAEREALEDLFRECTHDDPCGNCPTCCTDERGYEGGE